MGSEYANRNIEDNTGRQETIFGTIFQPSKKTLLVDDRLVQCRRYSYQPLRAGEIRLILIGRTASRTSEALSGEKFPTIELVCVPLRQTPSFRAISYAWGSLHDVVSLQVGKGSFLNTTRNLAQALRNFRSKPGEVQYLWADQLCIDQGNLVERGHQVGMMNQIYSKAAKCVAWLGEEDDDTLLAFETIKRVKATGWNLNPLPDAPVAQRLLQSKTLTAEAEFRLSILEDRQWYTLRRLLGREWFSRLWILQEVVIPRVVYFKCGRYSCSQNELYLATFYLQQMRSSRADSCSEGLRGSASIDMSPNGIESCSIVHRLRCMKRSAVPNQLLSTLLVESRAKYQCSNPHDRVYALLGLVALVEDLRIPVDYTESVAFTYTKATEVIIESYRSLRVFGALGSKEAKQVPGLPSWVPDWSMLEQSDPVLAVSGFDAMNSQLSHDRNFRASFFHPHKPRTTMDANQLITAGRVIDRIQGDICRLSVMQYSLIGLEAVLLHFLPLFSKNYQWPPEKCGEGCDDSPSAIQILLVQTLTALYSYGSDVEEHVLAMENLDRLRHTAPEMLDAFASSVARGDEMQERPLELQDWLMQVAEISEACVSRIVVELAKYRLGLCPQSCQQGDLVCILHGSNVPVLLRAQGNFYEVVGQCYVHGIMEGEAVDWEEDEADLFTLI
ncbi:hypothetical protein MMC15_002161 [Xylographa vitiligo]|nr:hypothetical protein [Xylographa vitiligo]